MESSDYIKFVCSICALLLITACGEKLDNKLPIGNAISINGELSEKDWETAYRFEDQQAGTTILMFQDEEWVNIAIPIEQHLDLPKDKEIVKKRLSYTEIHLKTPQNAWTLHASSMNGQKPFLSKSDFEWDDFENWKANPEGIQQNGQTIICEAYEYRIHKKMIASDTFSLIATIHPFYKESFDLIFIPKQESAKFNEWISIAL